jgi:hypothetical protein
MVITSLDQHTYMRSGAQTLEKYARNSKLSSPPPEDSA